MPWLTVTGVKPYDGRYEFALGDELTTREWGWIKRLAGYMPLTLEQGLEGADPELFAALAVIAIRRAGTIQPADVPAVFERLIDAPFGSALTLEVDDIDEEADDGSPPPPSSSGNSPSSGTGSTTNSETSAAPPNGSGTPDSDTSAWHPLTSAS